jgi:hypothetical protein
MFAVSKNLTNSVDNLIEPFTRFNNLMLTIIVFGAVWPVICQSVVNPKQTNKQIIKLSRLFKVHRSMNYSVYLFIYLFKSHLYTIYIYKKRHKIDMIHPYQV